MNNFDRAMLGIHGYIDRRDQSGIAPENRLRLLPAPSSAEERCAGCAATACGCGPRSTASARRPETREQARTWQRAKNTYLSDGFCESCSVQAAYGHQIGFSQVAPVCSRCAVTEPSWRNAGDEATKWARSTPSVPGPLQIGAWAA